MTSTQLSGTSTPGTIIKFGDYDWRTLAMRNGKMLLLCDQYNSLRVAYDKNGYATWWWLRSPGESNAYAAIVNDDGEISIQGPYIDELFANGAGLRPALWLSM